MRAAKLELVRPVSDKDEYRTYTVGRNPRSSLVLAGKKISSNHARITFESLGDGTTEGVVKLQDTSSNGTYVRGQKVRQLFRLFGRDFGRGVLLLLGRREGVLY